MFIGVAEENKERMVGRKNIKVSVSQKFNEESEDAIREKRTSEIVKSLEREPGVYNRGISLDIIFTDRELYDLYVKNDDGEEGIEIIKVLNVNRKQLKRTLLLAKMKGVPEMMVLKCTESELYTPEGSREVVKSTAQHESEMLDEIPENIKHLFVKKYAHGRMWFGSTSYEVILMESLHPVSVDDACLKVEYSTRNSQQYEWISMAFALLKETHDAGYSHGDAQLGNILWKDGMGKGAMKFINCEHMMNLNQNEPIIDSTGRALKKIGDIGTLLLRNDFMYQGVSRDMVEIDVEALHQRLRKIQDASTSKGQTKMLLLDDTLPFSNTYKHYGTWHLSYSKNQWSHDDQTQFAKMAGSDLANKIDDLVSGMTDKTYAAGVVVYLMTQINKTFAETSSMVQRINDYDLNFPENPHHDRAHSSTYPTQPNAWSSYFPNANNMNNTRSGAASAGLRMLCHGKKMFIPSTDYDPNPSKPAGALYEVFIKMDSNPPGRHLFATTPSIPGATELDTTQRYLLYLADANNYTTDTSYQFEYNAQRGYLTIYKGGDAKPTEILYDRNMNGNYDTVSQNVSDHVPEMTILQHNGIRAPTLLAAMPRHLYTFSRFNPNSHFNYYA